MADVIQTLADAPAPQIAPMMGEEERKMRVAQALADMKAGSDYSPIRSWTQGLARVADAAYGGWQLRKLNQEERDQRAEYMNLRAQDPRLGGLEDATQPSRTAAALAGVGPSTVGTAAINGAVPTMGTGPTDITNQIVKNESSGNPYAVNPRSSAAGSGQFINSTWLDLIKKNRPDLMQGRSQADILALRNDPQLSREMTTAYAQSNQGALTNAGLPATPGSTYLAHFAGPQGAIAIMRADPKAPVASVLGDQVIKANPFLANMTAGDLVGWANKKMAASGGATAGVAPLTASAPAPAPAPASAPSATEVTPAPSPAAALPVAATVGSAAPPPAPSLSGTPPAAVAPPAPTQPGAPPPLVGSPAGPGPGVAPGTPGRVPTQMTPAIAQQIQRLEDFYKRTGNLQALKDAQDLKTQFSKPVDYKFQVAEGDVYRTSPTGGIELVAHSSKTPNALEIAQGMMADPQKYGYSGPDDPQLKRDVQNRLSGLNQPGQSVRDQADAAMLKEVQEHYSRALSLKPALQTARNAIEKAPEGMIGGMAATWARVASGLGIPIPEGANEAQLLQSITTQLAPLYRQAGSTSDLEMRLYSQAAANLGDTKQANLMKIHLFEKLTDRAGQIVDVVRKYAGTDKLYDKLAEIDKPIFSEDERKNLEKGLTPEGGQPNATFKIPKLDKVGSEWTEYMGAKIRRIPGPPQQQGTQ